MCITIKNNYKRYSFLKYYKHLKLILINLSCLRFLPLPALSGSVPQSAWARTLMGVLWRRAQCVKCRQNAPIKSAIYSLQPPQSIIKQPWAYLSLAHSLSVGSMGTGSVMAELKQRVGETLDVLRVHANYQLIWFAAW